MIAVTYHDDYNKYDLGTDHPLIRDKPRKTMEFLEKKNIIRQCTVITPEKATETDLLRAHDLQYVTHVKQLSMTGGWLSQDTPAPKGIYEYACLSTGGSIQAGEQLFKKFVCAVNPLGGFHHASSAHSSGFCFFNDIAVTIEYLREKYKVKRFEIIDLDVHHGNGTQDIYYSDPTVLNISFHQDGRTLYPGTGSLESIGRDEGEGFTVNLPFPPGTSGICYRKAFDEIVPWLTREFKPELIVYQAGVDTHHTDPLADLKLVYQDYYDLAKRVTGLSQETSRKLLVLLGGGYNSDSCLRSYYNIFCALIGREDIEKEPAIEDPNVKQVELLVNDLKKLLHSYWKP
ncbi:MAG: histone deacetylase [Methanobacteriota archaeon]